MMVRLIIQYTLLSWVVCTVEAFTIQSLQGLTVKELKQLVVDNDLNERGLMSKLKRKQDFVDFLTSRIELADGNDEKNEVNNIISTLPDGIEVVGDGDISIIENDQQIKQTSISSDTNDGQTTGSNDINSFPKRLREKMIERGLTELLPIQSAAYKHIQSGEDAVIHAPTGSGKTLAFVLPLVTRMIVDRKKFARRQTGRAACPRIVVLVPSRELAKQVGKEFAKFSHKSVVTLFGGVPKERQIYTLKSQGAHVVVSTPGRLRELVNEDYINYDNVQVLVLDEADAMLDAADSPDVKAIMNDITQVVGDRPDYDDQVYQLLLISATVNKFVRDFATNIMEIPPDSKNFITVKNKKHARLLPTEKIERRKDETSKKMPTVHHWYTSAKTKFHPTITRDLISTLDPKLTFVFVQTKADTETVASFLRGKLGSTAIHVLHGDMPQASRSKTIARLREGSASKCQVLVATDVASRGLDLPDVDLVVQFGIPRISGKEGTYNTELYTHRTGRAGRVGMTTSANTIMLYDPSVGEGKFVSGLAQEVRQAIGKQLQSRPIPSAADIVEAGYQRAVDQCLKDGTTSELSNYFRTKLEDVVDTEDPEQLLTYLSTAMASLSQLDTSLSSTTPHASLLTGDTTLRTLRVFRDDGQSVSPPEVTKFAKVFGSGKLGRVEIQKDGSAIFDLPSKRANRLIETVKTTEENLHGWDIEMPLSLLQYS